MAANERQGTARKRRKAPDYIANFDSTSAMLRAVAGTLRGEGFPRLGTLPPVILRPVEPVINNLPRKAKEFIYRWSGWTEAVPSDKTGTISAEELSEWVVGEYPRRQYPAIAVGSSNGAASHLWAAMGIPWLPQTFLCPVKQPGIHPDEPKVSMEWAREPAAALLEANPELQLHHMHDANQDRLMIARMSYFRVKRRTLGPAYEAFIKDNLEPGGTIFVVECGLSWPTTRVDDRYIFQSGALGGATQEEFQHGSPRVEEYLKRYGSPHRKWDSPEPDGHRPEAEWGFEPAMRDDVLRLAKEQGYRVQRVIFDQPEDMSPLVADLFRWWYRKRSMPENRLLVSSFIIMEPLWTMLTGSVPFWMVFNMEHSEEALGHYLTRTEPYDYIHLMLFSHGVECVGLVPIERWRALLGHARKEGSFVGVDERAYPMDFAIFNRYQRAIKEMTPARYPPPPPLQMSQLQEFLAEAGDRYEVSWEEGRPEEKSGEQAA